MVMRSDTAATAPASGGRSGWSDRSRYMAAVAQGHVWKGKVPEGVKPGAAAGGQPKGQLSVRVADSSGGMPAEIVAMWANAAQSAPRTLAAEERPRGGYLDKLAAEGKIDPNAPVNVPPDWQGLTRDVNGVVASMLPVAQAARFFGADSYADYLDDSRAGLNPLVARAVEYAGHLGGSGAPMLPQVPTSTRAVPVAAMGERAATAAIDAWMPQGSLGMAGGRPHSLSAEQRAQILKLRSEGKSNSEIARHVGTSAPTVSRVANAGGDVRGPTPRPRALTPSQEAQLAAERAAGVPDKQLAHKYGVDQSSVGIIDRRHRAEKQAAE